jgi:hypothetical protein
LINGTGQAPSGLAAISSQEFSGRVRMIDLEPVVLTAFTGIAVSARLESEYLAKGAQHVSSE